MVQLRSFNGQTMSVSSRPKRRAAARAPVIILDSSDSEDSGEQPEKRQRTQRWPTKKDETTENVASTSAAARKNQRSKKNPQTEAENIPIEEPNDNPNELLPATTGRSSLRARRKVWSIHELLAETTNIEPTAARNIVQLFENENTIPFICRYRRDLINRITPEQLREIKSTYTEIVNLRKRAENIVTQLGKENRINDDIQTEIMCAKTQEELEFLYAPYKPANKGSLAERAKALGLEKYADRLLYGEAPKVEVETIVDPKNPDMDSVEKILTGICHIISHNISKHTGVLEELRRLRRSHRIVLKSSKTKGATSTAKAKISATGSTSHKRSNKNNASKYENYFEFQCDVRSIKPHQILAINRGEKLKFLSVKLIIADYFKTEMKRYIRALFMEEGMQYELRNAVFERSFEECYTKKLQPLLTRQIRSDLNEAARKAAIDVFAKNLKQLLLMSPLKGERILGIDPGYTNGCKFALISETADVLETGVIYPHSRNSDPEECGEQLAKILIRHNCKLIALGNGTACRDTEIWLTKLFHLGILDARTMRYSIVSEQGASVYSCSEVARKEFPDMDTNEISAVSIARRLNDPLSEYVKIEPRHMGVGMYQHDVNEKALSESLNEVVSECVSYVGVDINTASVSLLKYVAGLTEKKAEKIIQHRLENGPFRTRNDLLRVRTIGEKTFIQCAGFIRIDPRSLGGTIDNPLDCTWVHPESYVIAKKIISNCKLHLRDIGSDNFIAKIRSYCNSRNMEELAKDFQIPVERLEILYAALQRELFKDYRADFDKRPLFKQGISRLADLSEGDIVTGAVTNLTDFGAFVDIGVETDALIHISKMNNMNLNIGDRVTASIVQVDVQRKRIGLRLEEMLLETDT